MHRNSSDELEFLKSALTIDNAFINTEDVLSWIQRRNEEIEVEIKLVPFSSMTDWYMDEDQGRIRHRSGKFFSIDGIRVETNWGGRDHWEQPIINQPEIGFLGLIAKKFKGVLYFLVQAKIEPGNINCVQISPTLQATKSNYIRVHKGKEPLYLEYFKQAGIRSRVLLDQLQSEQGARFLHKRNRNIIVEVKEEIPVYDDFCWLTLGQIKQLMQHDNIVNMDLRTVVSGIPYGSYDENALSIFRTMNSNTHLFQMDLLESALATRRNLLSFDDIITWFTGLKAKYELQVNRIPLQEVKEWNITDERIYHQEGKYFEVIFADVVISSREVRSWNQPLVAPAQEGIAAFIVKRINGILHFLTQAKLECGNFDILEFAPTVQCLTGSYRNAPSGSVPFIEYVLQAPPENVRMDILQSEEGGRFYHEQNRNMLIEADDDFPVELPPHYQWMTLNQLQFFLKFNNYLNIQTRSLIAAASFVY